MSSTSSSASASLRIGDSSIGRQRISRSWDITAVCTRRERTKTISWHRIRVSCADKGRSNWKIRQVASSSNAGLAPLTREFGRIITSASAIRFTIAPATTISQRVWLEARRSGLFNVAQLDVDVWVEAFFAISEAKEDVQDALVVVEVISQPVRPEEVR